MAISIKPLADRVIVQPMESETMKGGIIIPDTAKEKPQQGKIVAVGPGRTDDNGNPVSLTTVTDANGYYSFDDVPPGTYTVTVTVNKDSIRAVKDLTPLGVNVTTSFTTERGRVRVHHGPQVRTLAIDRAVERILGRGAVGAIHCAIVPHADNVLGQQRAFVDTGRRDPHIAVLFQNGEVATRQCGHTVAVDPIHDGDQLVARV